VDKFTSLVISLSLDTLQSLVQIWFFGRELLGISRGLTAAAAAGAALNTALMLPGAPRLAELYAEERRTCGAFLYSLTRIRENAESIAFYGGQRDETLDAARKLDARQLAEWRRFAHRDVVETVRNTFVRIICALPMLGSFGARPSAPSGPRVEGGHGHGHGHGGGPVSGAEAVSAASRASEAFEEVLMNTSVVANNISDVTRLAAVSRQLHAYLEKSEQARSPTPGASRVTVLRRPPADAPAPGGVRACICVCAHL